MAIIYVRSWETGYYFDMATKKVSHEDRLEAQQKMAAKELKVFNLVKKLIDKADIEQLLKMGTPKDEYDPESRHISLALLREGFKKLSTTEIAYIVALVFHMEFHQWTKPIRYFAVHFDLAKEIHNKIKDLA